MTSSNKDIVFSIFKSIFSNKYPIKQGTAWLWLTRWPLWSLSAPRTDSSMVVSSSATLVTFSHGIFITIIMSMVLIFDKIISFLNFYCLLNNTKKFKNKAWWCPTPVSWCSTRNPRSTPPSRRLGRPTSLKWLIMFNFDRILDQIDFEFFQIKIDQI